MTDDRERRPAEPQPDSPQDPSRVDSPRDPSQVDSPQNPSPVDSPQANGDPQPGTTEWLLAQLSGGRIDSRRERREAEAALEAAGVPLPDAAPAPAPAEPAASQPTSETPADEKPRARFSWETGTLQAVDAETQPAERSREVPPSEPPAPHAEPSPQAPAEPIAFMWNLSPTQEPDPALNPHAELPEPAPAEPEFRPSAPLVVPRPLSPEQAAEQGVAGVPPLPEPPVAPAPAPAEPAAPETPAAAETPAAEPPVSASPAPAPLPPGTTAHEFDPFAPDLFEPRPAASTPVPPVDEFTIPDEAPSGEASVPTAAQPTAERRAADEQAEPGGQEVTSDWSDIADMLGAHPETVDTAIVSPMPPVNEILPSFDALLPRSSAPAKPAAETAPAAPAAEPAVRPAEAPIEHSRERAPINRWLLIAAAVLLAILIAIGLFALGRSIASSHHQAPAAAATHTTTPSPKPTSASPSPSPTDTAVDALPGTGPLPPGQDYHWDQLRGGECIDPFTSPWAQEFAVIDCNAQHAAQLVYTAPFASDPAAAFPGEQAIASQINLLCSKPGVVDLNAAKAYNDVQLVAAYPVTADQWNSGQRNYYCFATRSSGQPLTSSIAGPGPTQ